MVSTRRSLAVRSLSVATLALAPLFLAGCEKPDPSVTVWSGTTSVHESALCWQRAENTALSTKDCAADVLSAAATGQGAPSLTVMPGATVGVTVDSVVADSGWSIQIGGQTIVSGLTDTYFRFTFPETGLEDSGSGYVMSVTANAAPSGTRGHWFFRLLPG